MDSKDWLEQISTHNQIQEVLKTNSFTGKYGLELSEEEAVFYERKYFAIYLHEKRRQRNAKV